MNTGSLSRFEQMDVKVRFDFVPDGQSYTSPGPSSSFCLFCLDTHTLSGILLFNQEFNPG